MAPALPRPIQLTALVVAFAGACGLSGTDPPPAESDEPPVVDDPSPTTTAEAPAEPPGPFDSPGLAPWRPRPRLGWPVHSVHLTSSFGWRLDPVSGRGTRLHRGIDLRGVPGDLVLSIGDGRVEFVGHDPLLGTMVVIDHGDGLQSLYGHLSDVLVVADARIDRGAAIGLVGNTGRSAAPHLHLTVKLDGQAIDPLEVLGEPPHRPRALVTPDDAPIAPIAPPTEPLGTAPSPIDPPTPPVAQSDPGPGPAPPLHPLANRSDDGGEP